MKIQLTLIQLFLVLSIVTTCDKSNFYESFAKKDSERSKLEEARILVDKQKYLEAERLLLELGGNQNERRILLASAVLGKAGMGLLDIIINTLNQATNKTGVGSFFDNLDDAVLFGEGDTRTGRLTALEQSIDYLQGAANPKEVKIANLACLLGGILVLPTITSGTQALNQARENLATIASAPTDCPDIDKFDENLAIIQNVTEDFAEILTIAGECPMLSEVTGDSINLVTRQLNKLSQNADKGCAKIGTESTVDCQGNATCEALQLECVEQAVNPGSDVAANDKKIATCELLQNCLTPGDCFL